MALQRATWGATFREVVPPALLLVSQKVGGVAAGAFDDDRLVGFVYGLTGWQDGRPIHWSHMLAVVEGERDRGIGRRLKEFQRATLAAAGVARMRWTFDPLVARNAHLNLTRLGARVREYARDMYGDDPDGSMDAVIGTDRFVVEWDLGERAGGHERTPEHRPDAPVVRPGTDALPEAALVLVAIPGDIHAVKTRAPAEARAWRAGTRRAFEHYLPQGYRVTGVVRQAEESRYVLERGGG